MFADFDLSTLTWEYLTDNGLVLAGTPDRINRLCEQYEAIGSDLLLLLNYLPGMSHQAVMRSYELMGKEVIPNWKRARPKSADIVQAASLGAVTPT
jgi:alkanesulfonate monooxygenase SsuD/methylene tetrahydromethanopterin reductase-like flavin-dependent oxidoreductase (luciferase family)